MNILHYNLGVPPLRSGGLTKYSIDLAIEQSKENNVYILYPGGEDIFFKKDRIVNEHDYRGIKCYKIKNSLPISLLLGVKEPKTFLRKYNKLEIKKFFISKKIEFFHIHTFMGLNKEFLEVAKDLKIKIIYTTHDYFGLCPKVNLMDYKFDVCKDFEDGKKCVICNYYSPVTFKLNLLSMGVHKIYKKLKKILNLRINLEKNTMDIKKIKILEKKSLEYVSFRSEFIKKLSMVDIIHYNSNLSKDIYEKYYKTNQGKVILVCHNSLKKEKKIEKKYSPKIRIGFFGTIQKIKGFEYLYKEAEKIDDLLKEKIEFHIFGIEKEYENYYNATNFIFEGKYKQEKLQVLYEKIDYTVIPSICWETFNLVSLESKFFETPVIISNKIGAKEIFLEEEKIEFLTESDNLKNILESLIKKKLRKKIIKKLNENIWNDHIQGIQNLYKK
ncbi:MAG: glycosyltransferase [Cetobacterium sp.]